MMAPIHHNDRNVCDPKDGDDTGHTIHHVVVDSEQQPTTILSPSLMVGTTTSIPHHPSQDSTTHLYHTPASPTATTQPPGPKSQNNYYSCITDYSTTNCGSNTPMMTHCPNFSKSPTNSLNHNLHPLSSSPPVLVLPCPSLQLPLTGDNANVNTKNESSINNGLCLPSLFSTMTTNAFRMENLTETTAATTTNESTPLLIHSQDNYIDHDMLPDNDTLKIIIDSVRKNVPNHIPSINNVENTNSSFICILYGVINATIVIPVVLTFTTIIYSHPTYHPYLPILTQCTLFSSIIHQLVFSTLSSLPFAIGQVQDAGLIFLSNMATQLAVHYSIVTTTSTTDTTINIDHLIPTTMMALSVSTVILGISLILIGYFQLAQFVQLLPTCVIGGYLAYIGYFCGKAGILMMLSSIPDSNTTNSSVTVLPAWYYVLPGVVGGIFIYTAIRTMRFMITLPICILIEMILFYIVLYYTNTSIHDVTMNGWIRSTDTISSNSITDDMNVAPQSSSFMWFHTWDYFLQFQKIDWRIMLQLIPNVIGMIFVVTLSSSLDVTAIEIELQQQYQAQESNKNVLTSIQLPVEQQLSSTRRVLPSLNYNSELRMIGVSNILSGLFGGYTGSYIFSQSIFSLRAGIKSRLAGYVLALCEFVIFVLPIPILSYVPNFLFASLLVMICIDLIIEWLWDVRHRLTQVEYVMCLSTFVLIQTFNVEYGIIAGIMLYIFIQQVLGWDIKSMTICSNNATCEDELFDLLLNESLVDADHQSKDATSVAIVSNPSLQVSTDSSKTLLVF